jgi:hypothetical protein
MSEMVDLVAKAIQEADGDISWPSSVRCAVAAIEAMREPPPWMLYEGEGYCDFVMPEGFDNSREGRQRELLCGWQTMIDAALKP